ncbi:hypothetical protein VCHENC03_0470 [Vibrio sp. HENC-03]|nr:hypothetical protein VCHENC03_0470 [Vibrio sp. HENC-03]
MKAHSFEQSRLQAKPTLGFKSKKEDESPPSLVLFACY